MAEMDLRGRWVPGALRAKGSGLCRLFAWLPGILLAAAVIAPAGKAAAMQLTGAGSTFDYPFLSKAFYEYSEKHPDLTINYQSIGSGGGIQQLILKTIDFGATDVPMDADELRSAGAPVLQVPITLGGVAICYDLPGVASGLKLTPDLIAAIYLGEVSRWNDTRLARLNPGAKLPALPIIVVHRSDGSGTSYIFTDFLSDVSPRWATEVGKGKSVAWPAPSSIGGKGNEGVAGQVRQSPGAIGYIELAYVLENHMAYAVVRNRAGKWVAPSLRTVAAAAATKPNVSASDFSIVNRKGADSYPISGYSWGIVYQLPRDPKRAQALKTLMSWLVTAAQPIAQSIDYVPLPENVRAQALKTISQMETE